MGENDLKKFKTEVPDKKWKSLTKNLAFRFENFKCFVDYQKHVDNSTKSDFFSKLRIQYLSDEEIERTERILNCLILKMEKN